MSADFITRLRAALDEQERIARALTEPHDWHVGPGDDPTWEDESTVYLWPPEFHTPYEEDKHWRGLTTSGPALAAYIAAHDPAFVLADIAAKRAVIDAFEAAVRSAPGAYPPDASGLGQAVRLLAEAYSICTDGPTI
jgi:hypothetical protein